MDAKDAVKTETLREKCVRLVINGKRQRGKEPDELWVSHDAYTELMREAGGNPKGLSATELRVDTSLVVAHPKVVRHTVLVMHDV